MGMEGEEEEEEGIYTILRHTHMCVQVLVAASGRLVSKWSFLLTLSENTHTRKTRWRLRAGGIGHTQAKCNGGEKRNLLFVSFSHFTSCVLEMPFFRLLVSFCKRRFREVKRKSERDSKEPRARALLIDERGESVIWIFAHFFFLAPYHGILPPPISVRSSLVFFHLKQRLLFFFFFKDQTEKGLFSLSSFKRQRESRGRVRKKDEIARNLSFWWKFDLPFKNQIEITVVAVHRVQLRRPEAVLFQQVITLIGQMLGYNDDERRRRRRRRRRGLRGAVGNKERRRYFFGSLISFLSI